MTTPAAAAAAEAQQPLDNAFTLNGQHPADRVASDHLETPAVPSAEVVRNLSAVYQTVLNGSGPMSFDDVTVVQDRITVLSSQSRELREVFFLASLLDHEYARGIRCSVCNRVDNPLCTEEC